MGSLSSKECKVQRTSDFYLEAFGGFFPEDIEEGAGYTWTLAFAQEYGQRAIAKLLKLKGRTDMTFQHGTICVFNPNLDRNRSLRSRQFQTFGNEMKAKFDAVQQRVNSKSMWSKSQDHKLAYLHQGAIKAANEWNRDNQQAIVDGLSCIVTIEPIGEKLHFSAKTSTNSSGKLTLKPLFKAISQSIRTMLGDNSGVDVLLAEVAITVGDLQTQIFSQFNGLTFYRKTQKSLTYARQSLMKIHFIDADDANFEAKMLVMDLRAGSSSSETTYFVWTNETFEAHFDVKIAIMSMNLKFNRPETVIRSSIRDFHSSGAQRSFNPY